MTDRSCFNAVSSARQNHNVNLFIVFVYIKILLQSIFEYHFERNRNIISQMIFMKLSSINLNVSKFHVIVVQAGNAKFIGQSKFLFWNRSKVFKFSLKMKIGQYMHCLSWRVTGIIVGCVAIIFSIAEIGLVSSMHEEDDSILEIMLTAGKFVPNAIETTLTSLLNQHCIQT